MSDSDTDRVPDNTPDSNPDSNPDRNPDRNSINRTRGRPRRVENFDNLSEEIENKKRCPMCREKTTRSDYISKKGTGLQTKNCNKCRDKNLRSVYKKTRTSSYVKKGPMSNRLASISNILAPLLDSEEPISISRDNKKTLKKLLSK